MWIPRDDAEGLNRMTGSKTTPLSVLEHGGGNLVAHSCPTLCNPIDCSPPGSSVHGVL